jgi:hypothetical protein
MSPIGLDKNQRLQTVAETRAFVQDIDALLSPDERDTVIAAIAADPQGGDLVPGSGGLRKRRIGLPGRGKRGGARVLTLYLGEGWPVYAVYVFAKNERADLSPAERKALDRVVRGIKDAARVERKR